mgnify:FL=1
MSTAPRFITKDSTPADEWAASPEREVVFSVERRHDAEGHGDAAPEVETVDYTMPKRPNVGLALQYLKRARREGADLAMSWLIETAVGEEGYDALTAELSRLSDPAEAQGVLQGVTERIQKVALGGLEAPKA